MNSIKVLHCADLHIGAEVSFLGENAEKRRFETLLTFEKIISLAFENKVDFLLISGDLFDSNNIETEMIERVFEGFNRIPDTNIIFAAGNHDPLNSDSPFFRKKLNNLYLFDGEANVFEFPDKKTRIYGKSFLDSSMQGEANFKISPIKDDFINILVIHGELKSDLNSSYNAITPEFIKTSDMHYIALGHVHTKSGILELNGVKFAYPGCPEGQGFDELDEKGIYLGEISKENVSLEFIPTSKRQHIEIEFDVTDLNNSADIANEIIKELKLRFDDKYSDNLYKLVLVGATDEGFAISLPEIESRISESVYFIKLRDKTTVKIDFEAVSKEPSLKGIFVKNMLAKIENATDETEKKMFFDAMNLGLKAFNSEVYYNED